MTTKSRNTHNIKRAKKQVHKINHNMITTVFMNGQGQAVRIPKEYRLSGKKVYIAKYGNCLMLAPIDDPWKLFCEALNEFSSDFMQDGRHQPLPQENATLITNNMKEFKRIKNLHCENWV